MKNNKRTIFIIVWIGLGISLTLLSYFGLLDNFYNGMGISMILYSIIQQYRFHRLSTNPTYREKIEIEQSDERLRFIRNKAWAWSGYLLFYLCCILCLILKILGFDDLSILFGIVMIVLLILYWICYFVLKRKY